MFCCCRGTKKGQVQNDVIPQAAQHSTYLTVLPNLTLTDCLSPALRRQRVMIRLFPIPISSLSRKPTTRPRCARSRQDPLSRNLVPSIVARGRFFSWRDHVIAPSLLEGLILPWLDGLRLESIICIICRFLWLMSALPLMALFGRGQRLSMISGLLMVRTWLLLEIVGI